MNERIDQLRTQLREDPSSRLFFQLGELLRKEGQLEEAVEVLRNGLEVYPRYVAAWVSLGRALYDLASFADAESAFSNALNLDPENPIAARMMGETAMGRQDWVQAIKSLKLARVFSPRDDELEEKIEFVEQRLSELGLLEGGSTRGGERPAAAHDVAAEAEVVEALRLSDDEPPFSDAVPPSSEVPVADWEIDDQTVEPLPSELTDDRAFTEPTAPSAQVFNVTLDDPFTESRPTSDTGVFVFGDDVFGAEPDAEATVVDVAQAPGGGRESTEPVAFVPPPFGDEDGAVGDEPGADTVPGVDLSVEVAEAEELYEASQLEPGPVGADDSGSAPARGTEAPSVGQADAGADDDLVGDLEYPIPTLTLARLALEQGDHDLAESTLLSLLEVTPGHLEATEMLAALRGESSSRESGEIVEDDLLVAKKSALNRWLDRIQTASTGGSGA